MLLAEIGTAGVISAYFFLHIISGYSLNVSDPIEGQPVPVQLSYYLCVFGCGLVFWLLVLLWAKLHEVAKLAKLITSITTLNLCGCLLAPFMKLPLLVRFLVLFQVSSNLALLLIWADVRDRLRCLPKSRGGYRGYLPNSGQIKRILALKVFRRPSLQSSCFEGAEEGSVARYKATRVAVHNVDGIGGKVDEAGESGSGHGSGASGREENRGKYGGNDGGGGAGGGGDRGASGNGHGSGAGGSVENRGRSEGVDRGRDGGGGDSKGGGRGTNTEQAFKSSKITEMSLMVTAQTTAALIGFHLMTPSSSLKALLVVLLIDQLVAYLCGLTSILLSSNKPEDSKAAKIFAKIGFVCTALGFILMVAMFVTGFIQMVDMFVPEYFVFLFVFFCLCCWFFLVCFGVCFSFFLDKRSGKLSGKVREAIGKEINRGRYKGNDGWRGAGGGGDRGASGSGHGSGASGSGENSGGYGDHGLEEGGTGSGHGSGAGGSGENRGGSEGGDRGRDGAGADPEGGGRGTNTEWAFKSSKLNEMSLMLTAQTTATLIGFHLITTPSSSTKALPVVVMMDQLVAYLCALTSIFLSSINPEAANIFAKSAIICTALGFILMVAMFVPWYLVLIAVLLFGVFWLIFFRKGLKTLATKVWNYLKNCKTRATEVRNYLLHRDAI